MICSARYATVLWLTTISFLLQDKTCSAFVPSALSPTTKANLNAKISLGRHVAFQPSSVVLAHNKRTEEAYKENNFLGAVLLSSILITAQFTAYSPAVAFDDSDYASETVAAAVRNLNNAIGDRDKSFAALKDVGDIITEGKGIGGSLSYGGVQLERGLVADEDTSIYNPGLTLLTESEKERLVDAVIRNRKGNMQVNSWSEDNELGYDFLKTKLDPLHTAELKGYLGILPFYGAAVYLATLFVQQNARQLFSVAYIVGALAVFGPIAALIAKGP